MGPGGTRCMHSVPGWGQACPGCAGTGDRAPLGANGSRAHAGPRGHVDSSTRTKGPLLCHRSAAPSITCLFALLFWTQLCPHTPHLFAPEQPHMTKADASQVAWVAPGTHHLLVQAAGEVTQHCARCLVASHPCHCHHCPAGTAPSGSLTGTEPIPLLCPAPAKHVPKLWDTKQRHPASPPLQSQRSLCCPCRVGWCSATFEH